jgi:hypothetical protein
MRGHKKYLRVTDIVRLMGVSIRTVRRWIADEPSSPQSSVAPGSWLERTLDASSAPLFTRQKSSMTVQKTEPANQYADAIGKA